MYCSPSNPGGRAAGQLEAADAPSSSSGSNAVLSSPPRGAAGEPTTGRRAAIGPVARFAGPDKLVAYLGLNPSVHQSGEGRPRHGRITKRGRTHARTMLVEAAWQAVRGPGPLRAFYHRVATRRGQHIAAVAVARKLAAIVWRLLRRGEDDA
jgi:hypothetical protein